MQDLEVSPLNAGQFILLFNQIHVIKVNGRFDEPDKDGNVTLQISLKIKPEMISTKDGTVIPKEYRKTGAIFQKSDEQCKTGFPVLTVLPEDPTNILNSNIFMSGEAFRIFTGGQKIEHAIPALEK